MLLRRSAAIRVEFIQMKCTAAAAATVNGFTCDSAASPVLTRGAWRLRHHFDGASPVVTAV